MTSRVRKDVARNNRAILKAAGEMLRTDPSSVTIPAIAERAGLSAPTVYRYYGSVDALLSRYLAEVVSQVRDFSHDCELPGAELFDAVLQEWGATVETYGSGLVQLRSRRGFLERLSDGDVVVRLINEAWGRPIRRLLRTHGVDDAYFESALFLFNMMFDPRELLDLTGRGLAMPEALGIMKDAYIAALRGWQAAGSPTV